MNPKEVCCKNCGHMLKEHPKNGCDNCPCKTYVKPKKIE